MSIREAVRCLAAAVLLAAGVGCARYVVTGGERCATWNNPPLDTTAAPTIVGGAEGRVIGRVVSGDVDRPLDFARIQLRSPALSRQVQGDSAGIFVLDSVPPGEYLVRVHRIAYMGWQRRIVVMPDRGDTLTATLATAWLDGPCQVVKLPWWKFW